MRNLNHLLTHILDFCAICFGTRHAVYDPAVSFRPFSQIPLHRLRLDLLYLNSLFSYCPSRRRGKSQGTVPGSPLLRVFKQNSEEVAGFLRTEGLDESGCRKRFESRFLRRMLVRHWVRPCDNSRMVGDPESAGIARHVVGDERAPSG